MSCRSNKVYNTSIVIQFMDYLLRRINTSLFSGIFRDSTVNRIYVPNYENVSAAQVPDLFRSGAWRMLYRLVYKVNAFLKQQYKQKRTITKTKNGKTRLGKWTCGDKWIGKASSKALINSVLLEKERVDRELVTKGIQEVIFHNEVTGIILEVRLAVKAKWNLEGKMVSLLDGT